LNILSEHKSEGNSSIKGEKIDGDITTKGQVQIPATPPKAYFAK
jgi:hypothetical protein